MAMRFAAREVSVLATETTVPVSLTVRIERNTCLSWKDQVSMGGFEDVRAVIGEAILG